jgi:hypothetical protein
MQLARCCTAATAATRALADNGCDLWTRVFNLYIEKKMDTAVLSPVPELTTEETEGAIDSDDSDEPDWTDDYNYDTALLFPAHPNKVDEHPNKVDDDPEVPRHIRPTSTQFSIGYRIPAWMVNNRIKLMPHCPIKKHTIRKSTQKRVRFAASGSARTRVCKYSMASIPRVVPVFDWDELLMP